MTSESFISQYEQFDRDWLSKDGLKWQGKDIDRVTEALTATVEKRAKDHIDDVGTELLRCLSVDKPIVATAGAGLIRFGKILVGALMNYSFIRKVLLDFALHNQEIIDKLNEDLRNVCKLDKVAQKVSIAALIDTAEETFRQGLKCSNVHSLPNIGHMNSVGPARLKVYSACLKTIIKIMTMAEIIHCQTFVPLALRREGESAESVISAHKECFLGPTYGNCTVHCESCISERPEVEIPAFWDFKRCHWKNHGKQEDNENVERLHDQRCCTIRLIKAAKKRNARECIPCFFMFGKHKPQKCILNARDKICGFCNLKGHRAGACRARFFNACSFIMQAKEIDMDIVPRIANNKHIRENRTEAFRKIQRYRSRTARMSYDISCLPQAMTRENTKCVLLGSAMLYKSDIQGPNKMTKEDITEMTSFYYQTHVKLSKGCIKPGLSVSNVDEILYD